MYGRYRTSPAIVSDPTMLNAPQLLTDPQDPGDPLGVGYDDEDEFGIGSLAYEGTMVSNPAFLVSPQADFRGNLGLPSDVAYGVGLVYCGNVDENTNMLYNDKGKLRGRHRTKHIAKKQALDLRHDMKVGTRETQQALRKLGRTSERSADEMSRMFDEAEEAEPSYADEAPIADALLAEASGYYVGEAADIDDAGAYEEAARILDFVGLPIGDGPAHSAISPVRGKLAKAVRYVLTAAERTSQEPIWVYTNEDIDDDADFIAVAVGAPLPADRVAEGWDLAAVANDADPDQVGLFGSKKRKAKKEREAAESGALAYEGTMVSNPAFLTSPQADFRGNLGLPSDVAYGIVVGNIYGRR